MPVQGLGFKGGEAGAALRGEAPPSYHTKMWIEGGGVSCALAMDSHRVKVIGMRTKARLPMFSLPRPKRPATTQTYTF